MAATNLAECIGVSKQAVSGYELAELSRPAP